MTDSQISNPDLFVCNENLARFIQLKVHIYTTVKVDNKWEPLIEWLQLGKERRP